MDFNGPAYVPSLDAERLGHQHDRIREFMRDGAWRTLEEIATATGEPQASISAQLRHLRKPRFGSFIVSKRRRGEPRHGLWEYSVAPPLIESLFAEAQP